MLTTTISKAALPNLVWSASAPGLLAILAGAFRKPSGPSAARRFAKQQPVPFAWL